MPAASPLESQLVIDDESRPASGTVRQPADVVDFITNAPEGSEAVVEAIIEHPAVRRVNFTGSTKVGRHLKPVLLKLGGKAVLVSLDGAGNAATFGASIYQVQICISAERIVIDEKAADEFIEKFTERMAELKTRDPIEEVLLQSWGS